MANNARQKSIRDPSPFVPTAKWALTDIVHQWMQLSLRRGDQRLDTYTYIYISYSIIYPRPISSLPVSLPEGGRAGGGREREGGQGVRAVGGGGERRAGGGGSMGGRGGRERRTKVGGRGREGTRVEWRAGGQGAREEGAGGRGGRGGGERRAGEGRS